MWYAVELGIVLWLLLSSWWMTRRGAIWCLHAGVGMVLGYSTSVLTGMAAHLLLRPWQCNLWLHIGVILVSGTVAFALVAKLWCRGGAARRARWALTWTNATGRGLLVMAVMVGWIAVHLLLWVVIANLITVVAPAAVSDIRTHSLVTRLVISATPRERMEGQQRAWRGMRGGLTRSVDRLLDATGAQRAMAVMDALVFIVGLEATERERLVGEMPELHRLADDPAMRAVVEDARLMTLVGEAGEGSMTAIYALGGEPAIQILTESPAMRAALAAVDPVAIRRHFSTQQTALADGWALSVLASSLDLDAQLTAADGWSVAPGELLAWPDGTRYGLAKVTLPSAAKVRFLELVSEADASCWVNDRLLKPESRHVYKIPASDAGPRLVVLLDFGGLDGPRLGRVRVVSAADPIRY